MKKKYMGVDPFLDINTHNKVLEGAKEITLETFFRNVSLIKPHVLKGYTQKQYMRKFRYQFPCYKSRVKNTTVYFYTNSLEEHFYF